TGVSNATSVVHLEEALAALRSDDGVERLQVLQALGLEFAQGASNARARVIVDEAVAMARRLGDRPALIASLRAQFDAYGSPDVLDEREAIGREMLQHAMAIGDLANQGNAHRLLRYCAFERGDRNEFERQHAAAGALLGRGQHIAAVYFHEVINTTRALLDADWDEAERLALAA